MINGIKIYLVITFLIVNLKNYKEWGYVAIIYKFFLFWIEPLFLLIAMSEWCFMLKAIRISNKIFKRQGMEPWPYQPIRLLWKYLVDVSIIK